MIVPKSWSTYMASVNSFLLQRPDHYVEFRKYVLNIIDWGKDKHLKDIRRSLDSILEEGTRKTSEAAKSRRPSSDDSASSSSRKRRASSGKGKAKSKDPHLVQAMATLGNGMTK
jgi:hypothetical protein